MLADTRVGDGLAGAGRLHALIADHHTDGNELVTVGIETDRGLLVTSLVATSYEVHAVNPMVASRYKGHTASLAPRPMPVMLVFSRIWSARFAICFGRSPVTATGSKRSR